MFFARVLTPTRTRFAAAATTAPRVITSSIRLYTTPKSSFSPQDIQNVSHSPDHILSKMPKKKLLHNNHRFSEFDLEGRVYAITGGGRGLGLSMAQALIEAGAKGAFIVSPVDLRRTYANAVSLKQCTAWTVLKTPTRIS
jgi:hypothetical protein